MQAGGVRKTPPLHSLSVIMTIPYLRPGEQAVLYDGMCKLCNGWVAFLLRHQLDRRVRFATVQSEEGKTLLRHVRMPVDDIRTIVLIGESGHWLRAQAICRVMKSLHSRWRIFALLRYFPDPVSNAIYNLIARNRYRLFGRYDDVKHLSPDFPERFIAR
ncbi:MAG: thiol-disulfide oxidoreductase [Pantoea eucrina]|jgi:predicted DCC family thiol-disulfide oxidoreductase YuxK|nr:thiol-disulfide oxidoreductase [Pantoea eucrina]